jgi:hypothetical protein
VGDPRAARQRSLLLFLRIAALMTFACAVAGTVLPDRAGRAAAGATVVALVATPLARVLWLAVRWARRGDWRFAGAALVLVVVALSGVILA